LAEFPKYYTALKAMEDKLKLEKKGALIGCMMEMIKTAFWRELETKNYRQYRSNNNR
jgi:hypothetical protein